MNTEPLDGDRAVRSGVPRRTLLGAGLIGAGAIASGRLPSWLQSAAAAETPPWIEASIPELQSLMARGHLTSEELTVGYLDEIASLNPLLGAVIEINPRAVQIAARRDRQRRRGHLRGPLHGIPVVVKDNIATGDRMQTTAGSLALVDSRVPGDAPIVARLRAAGAVILGKANLSEWANFRGFAPFNGWSARGAFTRDRYVLSFDPCGSSSGSAVAPAANLCAAAVGTETDGSVVCPAGNNLVVGLKPTLGLLPQDGIIPIAHGQDTAGPMGRTVVDVAIPLAVMQTGFRRGKRAAAVDGAHAFRRRGLRGVRIGVDRRYFTSDYGGEPDLVGVAERGLDALRSMGATLLDCDTGDPLAYVDAEFTVLLVELKAQIAEYLATLRHTSMRTLSDLIEFNRSHCAEEMKYFGQEIFEMAEETSGDLTDPEYVAARELCVRLTRTQGIDAALDRDRLDAIVAPTYSFASTATGRRRPIRTSLFPSDSPRRESRPGSGCTPDSSEIRASCGSLTSSNRRSVPAASRSGWGPCPPSPPTRGLQRAGGRSARAVGRRAADTPPRNGQGAEPPIRNPCAVSPGARHVSFGRKCFRRPSVLGAGRPAGRAGRNGPMDARRADPRAAPLGTRLV